MEWKQKVVVIFYSPFPKNIPGLFCFFFSAVEFVGYAKSVVALIAKEAEYIGKEAGEGERERENEIKRERVGLRTRNHVLCVE